MKNKPFHFYVLFGLMAAMLSTVTASAQSTGPEPILVFDPGTSYATTRIPALVCTKKGTLLAFCEARVQNAGDWADMDILLRRSTDGGKTWLEPQVLAARQPKQPTSNCTPIVDQDGKTIHVLYQRNYSNCYYVKSTDEGQTWSEPIDITYAFAQFRPEYNWKVLAPGPGHAIQLEKGKNKGRIVIPVWLCEPNPTFPVAITGHRVWQRSIATIRARPGNGAPSLSILRRK